MEGQGDYIAGERAAHEVSGETDAVYSLIEVNHEIAKTQKNHKEGTKRGRQEGFNSPFSCFPFFLPSLGSS
jgi:hypothetical protein